MRRGSGTAPAAVALAAFIICLALTSSSAESAEIQLELTFRPEDLSLREFHGYQVVELKGCTLPEGVAGTPWLPVRHVNVLLPSGARATGVRITADEVLVKEGIQVCPLQPPQPLSRPKRRFVDADRTAYAGRAKTPRRRAILGSTRELRGYHVVPLRLNPVRYVPAERKLYLATKMTLTVSYRPAQAARRAPRRNRPRFKRLISKLVLNPDAAGAEPQDTATKAVQAPPLRPAAADVDYLLITNGALSSAFQALVDRRLAQGLGAALVTTETIYATYPGADNQEKIRNCIIDYYQNQGTVYVALGGDNTIVPDRDCYVTCGYDTEWSMPTDLYYGALDGTWDGDGDGVYGEAGSDGVDLFPEVFVGRIPVRTATDATNYITKVVAYETVSTSGFSGCTLLSGAICWNTYWGTGRPADFLDHDPVSDSYIWSFRMYRECIQPSSPLVPLDRFFDTRTTWDAVDHGDYTLTAGNLATQMSNGYHHLFFAGHGNGVAWGMESGSHFSTGSALGLTNAGRPTIVYTIACDTGGFDWGTDPCLSEAFLRPATGGAVAYIGCSRFGWGSPGSYGGGPSCDYARSFYTEVFANGRTTLGEAFAYHKMARAPESAGNGAYRWVQFGLNLQGDPAVGLLAVEPGRALQVDTPNGLEVFGKAQTVSIRWNAGGAGWQAGDQVKLEASDDGGGSWRTLVGAESLGHDAVSFDWVPGNDDLGPSNACRIRVTCVGDSQVLDDSDRNFTISGVAIATESPLPPGRVGEAYSVTLQAVGGVAPLTWSGGPVPAGLLLNTATGEISGTPTAAGIFTILVQVTDSDAPPFVDNRTFQLCVVSDRLEVTDSILPEDDLDLPFSPVAAGGSHTEQVTIRNISVSENVDITDIYLAQSGYYSETFNDGLAQDWEEDVDGDWSVQAQEYVAGQPAPTGANSMVASYSGEEWADCYVEVRVRKTALTDSSAQYLLVRASADFEKQPGASGSGYAFGYDNGRFYIFRMVSGTFSTVQGWTLSGFLNPDDEWNLLAVNAVGTTFQFFINGELVWTGTNSSIASGRIGLLGFTDSAGATTHYFDDVSVGPDLPLSAGMVAPPAQKRRLSRQDLDPANAPGHVRPAKRGRKAGNLGSSGSRISRLAVPLASAFSVANVPSLPHTLTPGQSVTFDVIFSPVSETFHQDSLTVSNSAGDVALQLSGSGVAGAEISGTKWNDEDGDGIRDPGEPGLENWTIYLDDNGNGQLDGGEASTTTDSNGDYAFTGLTPDMYVVAEVVESGWSQTWPPDPGTYTVTLAPAGVASDRDFGNQALPGEIRGMKWRDTDGDGVRDPGEPALSGWTIYIDEDEDGERDPGEPFEITDGNGDYAFTGLPPGTYTIGEELPAGWVQTYPGTGLSLATFDPWALGRPVTPRFESVGTTASDMPLFRYGEQLSLLGGGFAPTTAQSGPLINIDDFRADPRFSGIDGTGYAVVILDTGIDLNHPYFGPDGDFDGVADRIVFHYDFADGDNDASDVHGHGSNVSSIATSQHAGWTGMAPGANIIHLKVFEDGGDGNFGYLEQALQWVVTNAAAYNIVSVNMSLGDTENWSAPISLYGIGDELATLAGLDVIAVSASGNSFYAFGSAQGDSYPAADPNSLSIGAVYDSSAGSFYYADGAIAYSSGPDRVAPFSQRHSTLTTVFAPGGPITGANATGGTVTMHGTSQASPHLAGIVALAQQLAVSLSGRRLTVAEFTDFVRSSAVTINDGDDENDNVTNTGLDFPRVDMFALGEAILDFFGVVGTHTVVLDPGEIEVDIDFGNLPLALGPDPMTWQQEPAESGSTSITMQATSLFGGTPPYEYQFDFVDSPTGGGGGTNSGWQSSQSYADSGLGANHQYGYHCRGRDDVGAVTGWSTTSYDYTDIEACTGVTFGPVTTSSLEARSTNTPSGLARGSSGVKIRNQTDATDSGWQQNNNLWTSGSLTANKAYQFTAQSRNGDGDPTSETSAATTYTLPVAPSVTADRSTATPYPPGTTFTFTNLAGWGEGGVDHYHYVWDENALTTPADGDPAWSAGGLPILEPTSGTYYLHLKSHNPEDASGGVAHYGPYLVVIQYTLTLQIDPAGGGTTTPAEGAHVYDEGTVVPLGATPNAGYRWDQWTGPVDGPAGNASNTVTMNADRTVTAHFVRQFTLTMQVDPASGGTTAPAEGAHVYDEGTVVDLEAFADLGYQFDQWSGDVTGSTNPTTVTMESDKTVTAHFVLEAAPPRIESLELFYNGKFGDAADPAKEFLALGQASQIWVVGDDLFGHVVNCCQGISGIRVTFDTVVTFAGGVAAAFDFEATPEQSADKTFSSFTPPTPPTFNVDNGSGKTVVTLRFTNAEIRNRWLKTIVDASQVSAGGLDLDGELTAPLTLPSGDGTAGGNAEFIIGSRIGDVDGNYRCLLNDVIRIRTHVSGVVVGISNAYDMDKNARVLLNDAIFARARVTSVPLPALP